MAYQTTQGLPQTTPAYKGTFAVNGMPVGPKDFNYITGGVLDPNDTNNASLTNLPFGVVVSALATTPNMLVTGQPSASYYLRGISCFDDSIAYNQPFLSGGFIIGTPARYIQRGNVRISSYLKTATGAIDPVLGSLVIVSTTDGDIQFVASGTASAPTGYFFPLNSKGEKAVTVLDIEQYSGLGASGVGVVLSVDFS